LTCGIPWCDVTVCALLWAERLIRLGERCTWGCLGQTFWKTRTGWENGTEWSYGYCFRGWMMVCVNYSIVLLSFWICIIWEYLNRFCFFFLNI
jgi:hypothetical protein